MTENTAQDPRLATTVEPVFLDNVLLGYSLRTGVPGDRTYRLITRDGQNIVATSPRVRYILRTFAEALVIGAKGSPVENPEWEALILAAQDQVNQNSAAEDEGTGEDDSDTTF